MKTVERAPQTKGSLGPPDTGRGQEGLPSRYGGFQREHGPVNTLIPDRWPPEVEDNKPVLLKRPGLWHCILLWWPEAPNTVTLD